MIHLKIEKFGDAVAIMLDEAAQAVLGVKPGDTVAVEATSDDRARATETARQIQLAREVMADYRETLQELAK